MEMLKQKVGIDLVHVPYKGLAPAFNDVVAGQIPVMFAGIRSHDVAGWNLAAPARPGEQQ